MNFNRSLSDVEKILSEHKDLKSYIDKKGGVIVKASTLLAMLIAPDPLTSISAFGTGAGLMSFKFSKLLDWLPEKLNYVNKGKELTAVERYEKAILANTIVFHIAIREGVKIVMTKHVEEFVIHLRKSAESIDFDAPAFRKKIESKLKLVDENIEDLNIDFSRYDLDSRVDFIEKVTSPFLTEIIDSIYVELVEEEYSNSTEPPQEEEIMGEIFEDILSNIFLHYDAYIVHLSIQFPEFAALVDNTRFNQILKDQQKVLKELKGYKSDHEELVLWKKDLKKDVIKIQEDFIKQLKTSSKKLDELIDYSFTESFGFDKLLNGHAFLSRNMDAIENLYKKDKLMHIEAHHKQLVRKLDAPLVDNQDIEEIEYPKNKKIFVPQSFKAVSYSKSAHKKQILLDSFWEEEDLFTGENVGKYILNQLVAPANSFKPILVLGNPGAGKSMLSSMLAARLCKSKDFVPFFIRLRDVALVDSDPKSHINQGIIKSLESDVNVDWISWAKEFKNRTPVIFLDGFDELLQASQTDINNYMSRLQELLVNVYQQYDIVARIILTSRLTVMQDVDIPSETTIIRLNAFDEKRQQQWMKRWNQSQKKKDFTPFKIPNDPSIQELAKEPLLLFMLGVYDFEDSELQKEAKKVDFSQSKLYNKLFEKFTYRQLGKDKAFDRLAEQRKSKLAKQYRLRLGAIATLMYLNDLDYKETQKLEQELDAFGLGGDDAKPSLIFKGFFFIHKDQSTEASGHQSYTFEFIHKSFAEFLTADFLIRVLLERFTEDYEIEKLCSEDAIRFVWGFNWLHKHYNTTRFLFEHAEESLAKRPPIKKDLIRFIKGELKQVVGTKINLFPVSDFNLIRSKSVLEHLGMYSQNLILLWVAIERNHFPFQLYENAAILEKFKYEAQDRTEIDKNKNLWKKLSKLWELNANKYAVAKMREWVDMDEKENDYLLSYKRGEVHHNYSDSAHISRNEYDLLLSYADHPLSIYGVERVLKQKPEFAPTCFRVLNDKFDIFFLEDEELLLELSVEFLDSQSGLSNEVLRLYENLNLYFYDFRYTTVTASRKLHRLSIRMKGGANSYGILDTTGNLPLSVSRILKNSNLDGTDVIKRNIGMNHRLKIIEQFMIKRGIDNEHLTFLLFWRDFENVLSSSYALLCSYFELLQRTVIRGTFKGQEYRGSFFPSHLIR